MNTQIISRRDLNTIYNSNICSGWKQKIDSILSEQKFEDEIKAPDNLIQQAFSEANSEQRKMLNKYFRAPKCITDKIKSFSDVLDIARVSMEDVTPYKNPANKRQKTINAFAKLKLIEEVLNEGWIPDWKNDSEYKYYPYFQFKARAGCVFGSYYVHDCDSDGVPAYFKNSKLATFVGEVFINIYVEYING